MTRPGVKPDEMSICSSTPQHGGYTNSSLLEGDVKVRKCHAVLFLRNCLSRNNNSGNRDNKTYVLCPTLLTRRCIGVLKSIIMFFHSLPWNMRLHCFFTVNSSVNAGGDHLAGGSFMEKE